MTSMEGNLTHLYNRWRLGECCICCYSSEMTEFRLVKHTDNFQQNLTL